jgi:hypothetical protein
MDGALILKVYPEILSFSFSYTIEYVCTGFFLPLLKIMKLLSQPPLYIEEGADS